MESNARGMSSGFASFPIVAHAPHNLGTISTTHMPTKPSQSNTFVHKLYNMVVDNQYQHLIAWSYTGSSFIVCNITEFSRDVLPKHFKHNNFSSFVRQLNMYGFHKVNKSPRGHRTLAENQIWEFSHASFLKDRPDLLDDIKRKTIDTDNARRETGDLQAHMAMMQASQSSMMQQIGQLFETFSEVMKELGEAKRKHAAQQQMLKTMMQYILHQNGGQLPVGLNISVDELDTHDPAPPSIFITSPDPHNANSSLAEGNVGFTPSFQHSSQPTSPLSVQTQGFASHQPLSPNNGSQSSLSPGYGTTLPPSPSPSMMLSDDEGSLYSPHLPHTPRHSISHPSPSQLADTLDQPSTPQPSSNDYDISPESFTFIRAHDPFARR